MLYLGYDIAPFPEDRPRRLRAVPVSGHSPRRVRVDTLTVNPHFLLTPYLLSIRLEDARG